MGSSGKGGASTPSAPASSNSAGNMMSIMELMMLMQQQKASMQNAAAPMSLPRTTMEQFDFDMGPPGDRPTETLATRRPIVRPLAPEDESLLL